MRAFSSVGRALPLQGRCREFEPLNAHHKRPDDFCYLVFYFVFWNARTPTERSSVMEVRRERAEAGELLRKWWKSQKQNSELPFNASEQDKPLNAHHLKKGTMKVVLFLLRGISHPEVLQMQNGSSLLIQNLTFSQLLNSIWRIKRKWFDCEKYGLLRTKIMLIFNQFYLLRNYIREKESPKWLMQQDVQEIRQKYDKL